MEVCQSATQPFSGSSHRIGFIKMRKQLRHCVLQELEEKQGHTGSEVTAGLESDKSTLEPEEEGFQEAISVVLHS